MTNESGIHLGIDPHSWKPTPPASASLLVAVLGVTGPAKTHLLERLQRDLSALGVACQPPAENPGSAGTPQGWDDGVSIDERRRQAEVLTRSMEGVSGPPGVTLLASSPLQLLLEDPDPMRAVHARRAQHLCAVTLLNTDPSLASRAPERSLRRALEASGVTWQALVGTRERRAAQALGAVLRAMDQRRRNPSAALPTGNWRHACGRCGDPHCERQLFGSLIRPAAPATPARGP